MVGGGHASAVEVGALGYKVDVLRCEVPSAWYWGGARAIRGFVGEGGRGGAGTAKELGLLFSLSAGFAGVSVVVSEGIDALFEDPVVAAAGVGFVEEDLV